MENISSLYLDLMKRCVTNSMYLEEENNSLLGSFINNVIYLFYCLNSGKNPFIQPKEEQNDKRSLGIDWPATAHTMIGLKRLNNIQDCVEDVLVNNVPGDLIEAGVWRGGASIFMRAILKAHDVKNRRVWLADSFAGLPKPNTKKYPQDFGLYFNLFPQLAVSLEKVKINFSRYGLLDEQVSFLKGWFCDTLPNAPMEQLAVIRADGDLYESTTDILTNLYPKLSIGGYVIIDDYGIKACRQAVNDYREAQGIHDEIIPIDWTGIYWKRSQ